MLWLSCTGQVVERARPLGVDDPVPAALVLDLEPAFLDIDVRRAVLAHRAQLDQVDFGVDLGDREQQVQVADHIVLLRVHGMRPVDHGIRRGPLFGKVHHRVRRHLFHHLGKEIVLRDVSRQELDIFPGYPSPGAQAFGHRPYRRQRLHAQFVVP